MRTEDEQKLRLQIRFGNYEMNQKKYDSSLQLAFVSVFFQKKAGKKESCLTSNQNLLQYLLITCIYFVITQFWL